MPASRRTHHKIAKLPDDLVRQVNNMLATPGKTYQDIVDFLSAQGVHVSHSSVGRYGKDFLSRLERIQVVKEQARAIVDESGERPATEMTEAANQLAVQLIMEYLMEVNTLEGEKASEIFKALALLEKSATGRERLKLEYQQRAKKVVEKVKGHLKGKGISAETVKEVEQDILGIVR